MQASAYDLSSQPLAHAFVTFPSATSSQTKHLLKPSDCSTLLSSQTCPCTDLDVMRSQGLSDVTIQQAINARDIVYPRC
jgi:hypothetical protein